jgi:hypothetical protein
MLDAPFFGQTRNNGEHVTVLKEMQLEAILFKATLCYL